MLNYLDKSYREFIKDVKLGQNNADDQQIVKVLDVSKQNGMLAAKEIWPGPATQLFLSTNYDNASGKQPPDGAYDIPVINTKASNYTPLQITVVPYPEASAWKLQCSPNMTLPATASRVFYGKQTVTIAQTAPTEEEEIRWIQAIPAVTGSIVDPPRFRFYILPAEAVTEEEVVPDTPYGDAAYMWTFDSTSDPLADIVHGVSLDTYINSSPVSTHINKDAAPSGGCLCGRYASASTVNHIYSNNVAYARNRSFDEGDRYCWYDENTQVSVYTASDEPAIGDAVLDSAGNDTGKTVEDYYTPNPNYYRANIEYDGTTPYSFSVCIRPDWYGGINFGGMELSIADGNRLNLKRAGADSYIAQGSLGSGIWDGGIQRIANKWCHVAVVVFKADDITKPIWQYSAEKGYGLELVYTLFLQVGNTKYWGFVRDPSQDANGRFAWTVDPTLDPTGNADPPNETVWTDTETLSMGDEPNTYTTSDGADKVTGRYGLLKYRMRHDSIGGLKTTDTSYLSSWYIKRVTDNPGSGPMVVWAYHNGLTSGITIPARSQITIGNFINIWFTPKNESSLGMCIDELRIYRRVISINEALKHSEVIGAPADPAQTANVPNIGLGQILHPANANAFLKLTISDSTYMYDPLSTVFRPTADDNKAARYGWEKLTGNGPDHIWTDDLIPATNTKCYSQPTDTDFDDNLVIAEKDILTTDEIPLESHMTPYVIDEQTVAVVCDTHDFICKMARIMFPDIEALNWNAMLGRYNNGAEYKGAGSSNGCIIDVQKKFQPIFRAKMDDGANTFKVDNASIQLIGRWWECIGLWHWNPMQYRNCKPGDTWYVKPERKNMYAMYCWWPIGDYAHIAYLRLPTPMTEGSTHTITWEGNSCTFEYGKNLYSAAIKVNQEGYRAWGTRRYAYLGRWMGSAEAYDPTTVIGDSRTFYVVPAHSNNPISDAIYTGTMTQRCVYDSSSGVCNDHYNKSGKPIDGENTYELPFGNIESCVKDAIVVGSTTYFRDRVADWTDGSIVVNSNTYVRKPTSDASCAWAWYNASATPNTIYTDTDFPTTSDKARIGYNNSTTVYDITSVTQTPRYGWTTERITEESYGTAATVWTTTDDPAANATVTFEDGTTGTVSNKLTDQTTGDISGDYQIYIPHIGYSHVFNIGNQGVGHMFYIHSRGMFHQRSGCAHVNKPYTNFEYDWAGHDPIFIGDTWRDPKEAANPNVVWKVNPETKEPILSADGAKQAASGSGTMFGMCGGLESYTKHYPLYGVHGGWFDAADFDMREYHMECVEAMAAAYLYFPQNFTDNQLQLPESGDGVPDILSEALWGAELYRRAQFDDGSVATWFETSSHEKDWPWLSRKRYYRCVGDYYGTALYIKRIGVLVSALRLAEQRATTEEGRKRCRAYADMYTESVLHAWEFIEREFDGPWQLKPNERRTRRFGSYKDEMYEYLQTISLGQTWTTAYIFGAACELYRITHNPKFAEWLQVDKVNQIHALLKTNDNNWHFWICWSLIKGIDDLPEVSTAVKNIEITQANRWMGLQEKNTYRCIFWAPNDTWFSSVGFGCMHPEQRGITFIAAYLATNDKKYLEAMAVGMDHVTGCCSNGRTWTTGMGKLYPVRHLDSWLPRACVQRNEWTGRPGITLYMMEAVNYKADAFNVGIGPNKNARNDMNIKATQFDLFPAVLASKWNASAGTLQANVIQSRMPLWRTHACFEVEDVQVGSSEYTVWETMAWKMAISGILMGPGWKPKFWYNQVKPAKRIWEEKNYVMLP